MRTRLFLSLYLVLQTLSFQYNLFGVATRGHFNYFAEVTESMVHARLALTEQRGLLDYGGLLIQFKCKDRNEIIDYQRCTYTKGEAICEPIIPYKSRPSLQSFIFCGIDFISPFDNSTNLKLFEWLAALVSAGCLTWFLSWVVSAFSPTSGILLAGSFLLSPWITVSGGHLYWISGLLFLPFTFVAFQMKTQAFKPLLLFSGAAGLFFLKSLCIGYELVTTTLVMYTIPVFYYAFSRKWTLKNFLVRFGIVSLGLLAGLVLSMAVLFWQMSYLEKPQKTGFAHIQDRLEVRTTGNAQLYMSNPNIRAASAATLSEMMNKYWLVALFRIPIPFFKPFGLQALPLPAIFVLALGLLGSFVGLFRQRKRALALTVLVSILAPASWFVIFKAHSFLHPHLDTIAWFLPTVPLMVILWGELLVGGLSRIGIHRFHNSSFV